MKKVLSFALSFLLLTLSCFVPTGFAEGENTEELLGATFHRITLSDTAFSAGVKRDISFTVPATGNYALFINKTDAAENAYSAEFTQTAAVAGTESDYSVSLGGTDKTATAHKYNYTRVGAAPSQKSGSVYLYAGACTLSLTALNATNIKNIDLRGTDIQIAAGKTGILPADYYAYSSVTAPTHVNGELQKGKTMSEGYTYFNAPAGLTTTRQIHVENGRTVTYNLHVQKSANYRIKIYTAGYHWTSSPNNSEAKFSFTASLSDTVLYTSPTETVTLTQQSNPGADLWHELGVVSLAAGETCPLTIKTNRGRYIYDILVEETDDPVVVSAETLPAIITNASMSASASASRINNYFELENGESVTVAFKVTGEEPIDLFLSGSMHTEAALNYTYELNDGDPVAGTVGSYGKILENQTLSAGTHTLTLTHMDETESKQLRITDFTVASAENEDTRLPAPSVTFVSKDALITPVPLENADVSGASVDFLNNRYNIYNGGMLALDVDIEEAGYYTFYANARAPQESMTVLLDGSTDISNPMYNNTSVAHNNAVASTNFIDRKLTNGLVYLEEGEHSIGISASDLVELTSLSVRRSDGFISPDVAEETVIPAWDFHKSANIGASWYFPTQYYQSQSENVQVLNRGAYTNMRNVIVHQSATYTYLVNAEADGYYDFSAFFTSSNNTVEFRFLVDGIFSYHAVGTPQNAVGEAVSSAPMYLSRGLHEITVSRTTRTHTAGTARMYAVAFRKSTMDAALADTNMTTVEASFDAPVTGVVSAALYKGNKMVGISSANAENMNNIIMKITHTATPDKVKIFAWEALASAKPLIPEKEITSITEKQINLYLMGDSVCVAYGDSSFPQQGWGVYIDDHFRSAINVINNAVGGASTKTYKSLGHWDNVHKAVASGDYVMINFGLNDFYNISETGKGTTIDQYKENLTEYCNAIMAKGATPILISTIPECKENHNALIARSVAMEEVANALDVTFLNLNATLNAAWILDADGNYDADKTAATFEQYYLSEAAFIRLEQEWGKTVSDAKWEYIQTTPDRTHTNEDGAAYVAQTIASLLAESGSTLAAYLAD